MKKNIKTILLLLLFMMIGTNLFAGHTKMFSNQNTNQILPVNTIKSNDYITYESFFNSLNDTITTEQSDSIKSDSIKVEEFSIPPLLEKIPINFRINSSISYLHFNDFMGSDSKKLFFHAWLNEKELQKLSTLTDSLRKSYLNASYEQKEEISNQIIKAEQRSIALNEEIPQMYQKARETENQYWQSASQQEIARFQKKIQQYKDSVAQITVNQIKKETTDNEIPDTIILFTPSPKTSVKTSDATSEIIYKIQLAAYKGKLPESTNKLINKISLIRKVENYVDDKGLKVYTTGNLRIYTEAVALLGQVKQEGIKTAFITAYKNGQKTTLTEARKINNEL